MDQADQQPADLGQRVTDHARIAGAAWACHGLVMNSTSSGIPAGRHRSVLCPGLTRGPDCPAHVPPCQGLPLTAGRLGRDRDSHDMAGRCAHVLRIEDRESRWSLVPRCTSPAQPAAHPRAADACLDPRRSGCQRRRAAHPGPPQCQLGRGLPAARRAPKCRAASASTRSRCPCRRRAGRIPPPPARLLLLRPARADGRSPIAQRVRASRCLRPAQVLRPLAVLTMRWRR